MNCGVKVNWKTSQPQCQQRIMIGITEVMGPPKFSPSVGGGNASRPGMGTVDIKGFCKAVQEQQNKEDAFQELGRVL